MSYYVYECNGRYLMGEGPLKDPKDYRATLYAMWPGDAGDCPPEVAKTILAAGGWTVQERHDG